MKHFLLSLFIFTSVFSYAQDWFPFPLGQKSYFEQYGSYYGITANSSIHIYTVDSIQNHGNYQTHLFNYSFNASPGVNNCYKEAIEGVNTMGWRAFYNNEQPDSIITRNDSVFLNYNYYYNYQLNSILLIPKTELNNFWFSEIDNGNGSYNRLKFTCDSIYSDTIVGNIIDSVKLFSIETYLDSTPVTSSLTNKQLIISKNYGIKQMVTFKNNPGTTFPLTGIDNTGITSPELLDYFHLQTGDKIIWKYYEDNPIMTPDTTYYYQDSITSVISSPDSVIYTIFRTYDNGTTQNTYYRYDKKNLKGLFSSTSTFFTGNHLFSNHLCSYSPDMVIESSPIYYTNNIANRSFFYGGYSIDTTNCYFSSMWDVGDDVTFNTKYGLTRKHQFIFETDSYWTIEGSTINGVQEGAPWEDFLTSTKELKDQHFDFNVYPNPVSENGNIYIKGKNIESIEIYNLQGQKIATYRVANNQLKIDLSKGIYIMKAINGFGRDSIQKLTVY